MAPYVEARSILTGGGLLLAVGALVPVVVQLLFQDGFSGGDGLVHLITLSSVGSTVLVALGAALVGAGVVMRALEQGGVLGPQARATDEP